MMASMTASGTLLGKPSARSRSRGLPFFFRLFNGNRAPGDLEKGYPAHDGQGFGEDS
jgi:hypothetical protein